MPFDNYNFASEIAAMAGWGPPAENFTGSLALNVGEVKVLDNSECNERYFSEFEFSIIGREVVCTEDEDGKITATTGDSGGPVVVVKNGVSVVIGIIFSGKKGFPNVHTRVSSFYHWITQNTLARSAFLNRRVSTR